MLQAIFPALQHGVAMLFASVLLVVVFFLIARVAHVRQTMALIIALLPPVIALALNQAPAILSGLI